jgi:hypothetical protein
VAADRTALLTQIYGDPIPATALVLDDYLRTGQIPLRDPDNPTRIVSVDLQQAALEFGGNLADTDRHLHQLHAVGQLRIEQDGTITLIGPTQ